MQVSVQASCSTMDQIAACYTIGFKLFGTWCMHFLKKIDPSIFGEKSYSDFPEQPAKLPCGHIFGEWVHQDLVTGAACYLPYRQVSVQASCSTMDQIAALLHHWI